jgi:hypothetical protein
VKTLVKKDDAPAGEAAPGTAVSTLPEWARSTAPAIPDQPLGGPSSNFVGQLQENTGKKAALQAAGVQVGEFYLSADSAYFPLRPLRFMLLEATAYRTAMDAAGTVTKASRDFSDKSSGDEHIEALVIVDAGDRLIPAKASFRKAQWLVGKAAIDGLQMAMDPAFPSKGDAYKVAAQFPAPFGRVVVTASVQRRVSKTSGKPYFACDGTVTPSSVTDLQKLVSSMKDDAFIAAGDAAKKAYVARCEQLDKLCK